MDRSKNERRKCKERMTPRFLPGAKPNDGWCGGNGLIICRGDTIQGLQNKPGNAGKSFIYEDISS